MQVTIDVSDLQLKAIFWSQMPRESDGDVDWRKLRNATESEVVAFLRSSIEEADSAYFRATFRTDKEPWEHGLD